METKYKKAKLAPGTFNHALKLANKLTSGLKFQCQEVTVAGDLRLMINNPSLRRDNIQSLTVVAIPRTNKNLFNQIDEDSPTPLDIFLSSKTSIIKSTNRLKVFKYGTYTVNLYVNPHRDAFGYMLIHRTGPEDFIKWIESTKPHGALPIGFTIVDDKLFLHGTLVPTPTEKAFLLAIGLPPSIALIDRTKPAFYKSLIKVSES